MARAHETDMPMGSRQHWAYIDAVRRRRRRRGGAAFKGSVPTLPWIDDYRSVVVFDYVNDVAMLSGLGPGDDWIGDFAGLVAQGKATDLTGDDYAVDLSQLSWWSGLNDFTVYCESAPASASGVRFWSLANGVTTTRYYFGSRNAAFDDATFNAFGGAGAGDSNGVVTADDTLAADFKAAVRFSANDMAAAIDGAVVGSDNTVSMIEASIFRNRRRYDASSTLNRNTNDFYRAVIVPEAWDDATLAARTG